MKLLAAWMLTLMMGFYAHAQNSNSEISKASKNRLFKQASTYFAQGRYQSTVDELKDIETVLNEKPDSDKSLLGLVHYWKGISQARLQEFPDAIKSFARALDLGFAPSDIHYEYGQVLFASEKMQEARLQFRESVRKNFKRAVSLYYIGYISKEMNERKKAYTFFRAIDKLDPEEAKEVKQAAEMQIGDIYLDQVEKHPDAFRSVEKHVIPQYEKALAVDKTSTLAPVIQEKIITLQRKYDLIMFQLRNGRPTLNPPYFLRLAQEVGNDSNVTFTPTETTVAKSKQASLFTKSSAIGRYTFYHEDFLSVSPEFNFNYTRYWNREPEIYRNDNYVLAPALRSSYEHTFNKKPASLLLDYEYNEIRRDVNAKEDLEFNSRSHALMLGERFSYFSRGESVIRLRRRIFDSYLSTSDSTTTSLILEQVVGFKFNTLLLYGSYDMTRVKNEIFDTNSFTVRGDLIMARVRDWFTPSVGLMLTSADPINNRSARGRELLFNPNARLAKTFGKNWRGNLKLDYQKNDSKDEGNFAYKKTVYSFELEYLF